MVLGLLSEWTVLGGHILSQEYEVYLTYQVEWTRRVQLTAINHWFHPTSHNSVPPKILLKYFLISLRSVSVMLIPKPLPFPFDTYYFSLVHF